MKTPAFQFYPADFLAGTMLMTNEEVGLLQRLLCIQWRDGCVTASDVSRLSRMSANGSAMAKASIKSVLSKFEASADGTLKNPRLERERSKQEQFRAERSKSGRKGSLSRWQKNGSAIPEPMANDNSSSSSSSSIFRCTEERERKGGAAAGNEGEEIASAGPGPAAAPAPASSASPSAPEPGVSAPARRGGSGRPASDLAAQVKAAGIRFGALTNRIKTLAAKREAREATAEEKAELKKLRAELEALQKNHAAGRFDADPAVNTEVAHG